ncbi:transcription termination/antitermination protein NusG [Gottschalkia purinilytica]|uniref:Transcription termination/antitermination protein NusG n=1 Tax=Gottschalkia purinilytica TaxID=1503 RepID=A0A0L0W994_GOTPU|nr:transcription termination/antitermination protein NusG [Gottschalkia purinilytica]KNF08006.1 transcription termination/antitermination protein NusG [Gottschalkia purinilytica]
MTDRSEKGNWYVVHTYSGHENKVKANIEKLVENRGMQDVVFSVKVPTEEYTESKNGKKKTKERKMFPGYVLVKMIMTDESWYLVRNTRGVTGFVGPGSKPVPLSDDEIKTLGVQDILPRIDINEGEFVKVKSGPFENLEGSVQNIDNERRKLKVFVSMFGRETLVELDFEQVEKIY